MPEADLSASSPISIYIHIPFCQMRCTYCDFNTYTGLEQLFRPYTEALTQDIALWSKPDRLTAHTIYFGGGTPTVISVSLLDHILTICEQTFSLTDALEVTSEANPGTLTASYLRSLRVLGVNRLSLGIQSLVEAELRLLGRLHTADEAAKAVAEARTAGFENINLDLIYGLPGQSLASWQQSLSQALLLEPEHLSLYCLTLEEGTPLATDVAQGRQPEPDPDLAADMYECAVEQLERAGYAHYEISNWARGPAPPGASPSLACRHNLTYWRNQPYLGFGAGAHSCLGGHRWWNVLQPGEYIARLREHRHGGRDHPPAITASEEISPRLEMGETMMLGLRLVQEGVSVGEFARRFGRTPYEVYAGEMEELRELGLLEWDEARVRLTPSGWLLANEAFQRFL
jgi:oxygen-independent coproporphyrinogen-3 oxidase